MTPVINGVSCSDFETALACFVCGLRGLCASERPGFWWEYLEMVRVGR